MADFGAGAGYYTFAGSAMVGNTGSVYAIDISNDMLRKISNEAKQRNISNIHIINTNLEKQNSTKLKENSIDVVVIANILYQIEKKDVVAMEAKRILKKGGELLVVEWADKLAGLGPHAKHLIKKSDDKVIFEKAGLVFKKEIDSGDHHYGLLFRK